MATDDRRIPVTLVTGFLGGGKTTLLNRLLRDPAFRNSAVLVNEFGEIGIDHLLISSARDRVVLLDAGCLCCVMNDSLRETLADLYHRRSQGSVPAFERVLIETSGLADPGPILQSLLKDPLIAPLFALAGIVCVVDALHALTQLAESVEAREQVALADRLVLTKLDLCGGAPGAALRAQLTELNPHAEILTLPGPGQSVAGIFDFSSAGLDRSLQHAAHASHSSGIVSCSFQISEPVTWSGIAAWTAHLVERYGDDLLRCKALLRLQRRPGRVVVQGVRRLFELRHDNDIELADPRSPIVFIGRRMNWEDLQSGLAWLQAPEGLQQPVSRDFAPWLAAAQRVQGNLT